MGARRAGRILATAREAIPEPPNLRLASKCQILAF
jgi:hypothetical protein